MNGDFKEGPPEWYMAIPMGRNSRNPRNKFQPDRAGGRASCLLAQAPGLGAKPHPEEARTVPPALLDKAGLKWVTGADDRCLRLKKTEWRCTNSAVGEYYINTTRVQIRTIQH